MVKKIFGNRWVKFSLTTIIYLLWFVVWTGNLWLLLGVAVIYDIYISKFMYRLFWRQHKELKKDNKSYKKSSEWVEAILFATVAATVIRIFFFEMYVIPSPSMEKSMLVGDYLCVSKVAYGPKMPNTPVAFPFVHHTMPFSATKKSFSEVLKWPYHRLKGFGSIKRGDVVVFNFPAGDTVVVEDQGRTYYDYLRHYQDQLGDTEGRKRLYKDFTIITRPVDKRENYVKRTVGVPGDSIQIVHSQLFANGKPFEVIAGIQYNYYVYTNGTPISNSTFEELGVSVDDVAYDALNQAYGRLPLTQEMAAKVEKMENVRLVVKQEERNVREGIFPQSPDYLWNEDNYGPLWVPKKGVSVALNMETLPLYSRIVEQYEGNSLKVIDDVIYVNDVAVDSYTFKMDYYFMMGDNRHNSLDSRFWGFVPEDHVVGRPSFVWLSLDKDKGLFGGKIRWSRIFTLVKGAY